MLRWGIFLFWGLGCSYAIYRGIIFYGYTDFDVYYLTAQRFWQQTTQGGADFTFRPDESSPFRYAPIWGGLLMPLAWFPHPIARALWDAVGWLFYGLSLRLVFRKFKLSWNQFLWVFLATYRFAIDNSNIGQISAIFAFLLILADQSPAALAAAGLIKPHPVLLVSLYAWFKEKRKALIFLGALGVGVLLSLLWGFAPFQVWIDLMGRSESVLSPDTIGNQSLYGACLRVFGMSEGRLPFALLLGLAAIQTVWFFLKKKPGPQAAWSWGIAMLPVFGILTWKNTYLVWLYPLAFGAANLPRWWSILAALIFLLPSQGIIGRALNGEFLRVGVLPFSAWILGSLLILKNQSSK